MKNLDVKAFAKLYKSVVSNDLCDKTVSEMNTLDFKEHTFYNANTNEYKPRSGSQELSTSFGNVSTSPDHHFRVALYTPMNDGNFLSDNSP